MSSGQSADSSVQQARQLLKQRKVAEAIALLDARLKTSDADREAQELLGMACFMGKQYEPAKAAFLQLTRMDSAYAPGWVNLGAVQNLLEDYHGAAKTLRNAIKRDKKCASAYYNLGIAQKAMKMTSMAITAYREAIKLAPTMPEPYANLANIYIDMKNLTQAVRTTEEGIQKCPNSKKLKAVLAKAKELKAGNRLKESPLGRLVNEEELARKQVRGSRRDLTAVERNNERDTLKNLSKRIRSYTKPSVALLDEPLHQQVHLLHLAAAQKDTRGEAHTALDEMVKTVHELDRLREGSRKSILEIRAHLNRTDPGL